MPVPLIPIATTAGEFAAPYLIREAGKVGIKKFIETYGSTAFQTIAGSVVGGMILDKAPPLDLQKEKLFGVPVSRITGQGEVYSDIEEPKKVEPLKYIPGIHGPKSKEQEEIEKIGQKETFPIQEWDKSYTDTGTTIPEPEKETPPVNIPPEIKTDTGTPIPEQKTWRDYILTQTKTKDITQQTKDLVTKKPEFGALTETEKQTALLEKGDKPDFYSRAIEAITNAKQDTYTKGKWKSIVKGNTTKDEMDYLGLTELLEGKESISKQELLKLVKDKDIASGMTVKSIPKDQMNPMYEGYSLGGNTFETQEHIVFQIGKDKGEVGQLYKEPHFNTEYGTGTFAHARTQVGYDQTGTENMYSHNEEAYQEAKIFFDNLEKTFRNTQIVDEIQSQWIQTGQDKGFVSDFDIVPEDKLIEYFKKNKIFYKLSEVDENPVIEWQQSGPIKDGDAPLRSFLDSELNPDYIFNKSDKTHYETLDAGQINQSGTNDPIAYLISRGIAPDFPIKDTKKFVELVLNEMIRKAVKDGRDSIAITNGQIQYNRYPEMEEEKRQGLKKYYNTFVYDQLNKIAKNYGVELERIDISEGSEMAPKELQDIHLDNQIKRAQDDGFVLKKVNLQFLWDRTKDTAIPGHAALYSDRGVGQGLEYIENYLSQYQLEEDTFDDEAWDKYRHNEIYVWIKEQDISRDKIGWELPIVPVKDAANYAKDSLLPELLGNDLGSYKKYIQDAKPPKGEEINPEQLIKMKLPKKLQKKKLSESQRLTKVKQQTQRMFG